MTKYARIVDSVAVEILVPPEGFDLADCVHADIAELFTAVPEDVTPNSKVNGKGVWTVAAIPELEVPLEIYPVVTPMTFKMLFTSSERIAIKRSVATDDVIEDWWGIINDPNLTEVNLGLKSAQDGLDYLISVGIITPERKPEILSGLVK